MDKLNINLKAKKIIKTKSISIGLFELDERYSLGNRIDVFCDRLNTIYTFEIFNITLVRKTHWVVHLN
ncbi:UNVERIFIED_CONTAM: hypothetical protein ORM23_03345 [Bacillus cereus]|nr:MULTISPECIES: hypothetical protein [Bacillus cereus group]